MSKNGSMPESISSSFIQGAFKDALRSQIVIQRQMQDFLERNKPMFERIAEATKVVAEMHSVAREVLGEQKGQDVATIKQEIITVVKNEIPTPKRHEIHLSDESMDHIANKLANKIIEKQNAILADGKSKRNALFATPVVALPKEARWEDITVAFKSLQEIEVRYKDTHMGFYDYEMLGFAKMNNKDKLPDVKWELLQRIAVMLGYKNKGKTAVFPTKANLMRALETDSENGIEKRRSDLATQLRRVFNIDDNPFLSYDSREGYRPKFTLLPEFVLRGSGELHSSGMSFNEDIYDEEEIEG